MKTTAMTPDALKAAAAKIPKGESFYMLNMLRYNKEANYTDKEKYASCSGKEAYHQRYIPAFAEVSKGDNIQIFFVGSVLSELVAPPDELWDEIAIIQYPDYDVFLKVVESKEYLEIADPHRSAALNDWRLIAIAKLEMPS